MRPLAAKLVILAIALAALPAYAQIALRGVSTSNPSSQNPASPPAFRSANSATSTTATLTITRPSGTQDRDVLVASIAVTPSSATITPPTGWTLVRRLDNAGPTSNSLAVYHKVVFFVSGEPTSYAFGLSGTSFSVGGIQAFSGVETDSPVAAENGQSTPVGTSHTAPALTTPFPNTLIVTSHAFASSRTWTPPSGMTESFDRPSGSNSATGLSIEGARVFQTIAGTTGNKTATAAGNADAGNAHILALRPATVKVSLPIPAGTSAGDVMIAALAFNNSTAPPILTPLGWTLVRRIDNAATTSNSLAVYRKVAGPNEGLMSTIWSTTGAFYLVGGVQVFSGVDTNNPIDADSGRTTPSSTNHDTPTITTSTPNTMLVTSHAFASSQSWTPQSGLTEAFDRASGTAGATGQSITGGYQPQAATGASGTKRSTAAGTADVGNTHILALRPFTNAAPNVSLTSPTGGGNFTAPASITITATASDSDGAIQKVEFFHGGTNLITTLTAPPYSFAWTAVPEGAYSLTAVATDNHNATTTSAPVSITVNRQPSLHFVHVDHLNTPRLVADTAGTTVWKWDQQEPFGNNVADENPSGLGVFDLPLRLPGQYFDKETNLHYNYFRYYDPSIGRYGKSDPIGLRGGLNTYAYVKGDPTRSVDPLGLVKWTGSFGGVGIIGVVGAAVYSFDLTSECIDGKQANAKGYAFGGAAGAGLTITGTKSNAEFVDNETSPHPSVFNGTFAMISAGIAFGTGRPTNDLTANIVLDATGRKEPANGGAASDVILGGARSTGISVVSGIDASVSLTAGSSMVTSSSISSCACKP